MLMTTTPPKAIMMNGEITHKNVPIEKYENGYYVISASSQTINDLPIPEREAGLLFTNESAVKSFIDEHFAKRTTNS